MDIKVILEKESALDIHALSAEERAVLFETLARDNRNISAGTIDSFETLTDGAIKKNAIMTRPELTELLLKKVLLWRPGPNTIAIPIIKQGRTVTGSGPAPQQAKFWQRRLRAAQTGPAAPRDENSLYITLDDRALTVTTTGREYIAGPGEEIEVVGVVFNAECGGPPMTRGAKGTAVKSTALGPHNHLPLTDGRGGPADWLLGNYTYAAEGARACELGLVPSPNDLQSGTVVMFSDAAHAAKVIGQIYDYVVNYENIIGGAAAAGVTQAAILPLLKQLQQRSIPPVGPWEPLHVPSNVSFDGWSELVARLEGVGLKFLPEFPLATLSAVHGHRLSGVYYNALLRGFDHSNAVDELEIYKQRMRAVDFRAALVKKSYEMMVKVNTWAGIISKKFGQARLAEVELALKKTAGRRPDKILELLKPAERKAVEAEYERRTKYLEEVLRNKCAHVPIYKKFRTARSVHAERALFAELKEFFAVASKDSASTMISCKVCKFDIICPHIVELADLEFAGKTSAEIKSKMTKYVDAAAKDQHYCKVCGELVSSLEAFDDVWGSSGSPSNIDEELRRFIWGETASSFRNLKFSAVVDVPAVIDHIVDTIYEHVEDIERNILKSKTNTADEIKAKKRLYTSIYVFAAMINMIVASGVKSGKTSVVVSFRNFEPKSSKNPVVDLIKYALDTIVSSRNVVIKDIPGMSYEVIKGRLVEAFKSLQSKGGKVVAEKAQLEEIFITLNTDPIYHYVVSMWKLGRIITPADNDTLDIDLVEEVLGRELKSLQVPAGGKPRDIYENVLGEKVSAAAMAGGRATKQAEMVAAAYNQFLGKLEHRVYDTPKFTSAGVSDKDIAQGRGVLESKLTSRHEVDLREYQRVAALEAEVLTEQRLKAAQTSVNIPSAGAAQYRNPDIALGDIFDENGVKHQWDLLIVDTGGDAPVEVKAAELAKWKSPWVGTVLDKKCTVCGAARSKASGLFDDAKIREAIHGRNILGNFFRFYDNRCPKGGLHEYSAEQKCKKCGIEQGFLLNNNSKHALIYFKEFRAAYAREQDEFKQSIKSDGKLLSRDPFIAASVEAARAADELPEEVTERLKTWAHNFNVVLELATRLKINYRLLSALGSAERIDYADVQSGKFIPPGAESRYDTTIYNLLSHMKNFITAYNQLRYYSKLFAPPADLTHVIEESGVTRQQHAALMELPAVHDGFNQRFAFMQKNRKPRETALFLLQELCEMLMRIRAEGPAELAVLRENWVKYFVARMLRDDELLTKPGYFSWTLVYGEKETAADDVNFVEDEDEPEAVGDEEDDAPMNMDGFDVDADPDGDPEEETPVVRVEGFALD